MLRLAFSAWAARIRRVRTACHELEPVAYTHALVTDHDDHAKHRELHWLPKHPRLVRWDRSFAIGEATFRWHSRLDGTAVIHGPPGHFAVGDTVPMPVGHMHREGEVAPTQFAIKSLHEDADGSVWLEAVRRQDG